MEKCPKCGQMNAFEGGKYLSFQRTTFKIKTKFLWFPIDLSFTADLKYCPACGFAAAQNITTG